MSEPNTKLGKRLCALMSYDANRTDWDRAAADFANEIRSEAIPWAHKALDEVGAPKGPDIAGRIRELVNVSSRRSLELHARIEELERQRDKATAMFARDAPGLTDKAIGECAAYGAPSNDPSAAVVFLATLVAETRSRLFEETAKRKAAEAAREELRAIIVEAIKGGA